MKNERPLTVAGTELKCPVCGYGSFVKCYLTLPISDAEVMIAQQPSQGYWQSIAAPLDYVKPAGELCGRCGYVLLFGGADT